MSGYVAVDAVLGNTDLNLPVREVEKHCFIVILAALGSKDRLDLSAVSHSNT